MPFVPRRAHRSRFAGQWAQVQACLAALDQLDDPEVAELRVEIRSTPAQIPGQTWKLSCNMCLPRWLQKKLSSNTFWRMPS